MSGLTTEHTYLVAIDAWNTSHDLSAVKEFIRGSAVITDWWNYIPYVFLVVSPLGADALSEALKVHTKDAGLLVIEANPGNSQGLLPERAWQWIDRRAAPGSQLAASRQPISYQPSGLGTISDAFTGAARKS